MTSEQPTGLAAETRGRVQGRLLVLLAAVMWSTSGFFAKAPLFADWPLEPRGPLLAFWRALFALLVLVPLVRQPRWTWRIVPMVLLFAGMNFTYLSAMTQTSAANAIWMQSPAPIWVFLIGVFWMGERIARGDWTMFACGAAGVAIILAGEMRATEPSMRGVLYGLVSGAFYGGVVLSIRHLRELNSAWLVTLNHAATAVVLLPLVLYHNIWPSGQQWFYLAGFGMFQMGIPYLLFAQGVRKITGHEAAGIGLLEPVLVPVWVFLAWRHDPSYRGPATWTLIGGGLILCGLLLKYRSHSPRPSASNSIKE